ncbi:hypothetical protein [Methylobacterium pseudosasicola]|uniref:Uncharacterized protein n=1 Tax=Methylobacterium pseudosasicola TaxID=582667 RepID=A0A1I4TT78_9HYPH|nr:hypothetical protein [Methylobacterium pseudosasicola]SFM79743.1 hypothetical protein SAMN05192568_105813 [Methylobacterium pseudosasicola]
MATLLADPFGRQLLSLLTADYGLPGDPRRRVLRHELQQLQLRAEARNASRSVRMAIRAALSALRAEFPVPCPCPVVPAPVGAERLTGEGEARPAL